MNKIGYWLSCFLLVLSIFFLVGPLRLRIGFQSGGGLLENGWLSFFIIGTILLSFLSYYYLNPKGGRGSKIIFSVWTFLGIIPLGILLFALYSGDDIGFGALILSIMSGSVVGCTIIFWIISKLLAVFFLDHNNKLGQAGMFIVLFLLVVGSAYLNYNDFSCNQNDSSCEKKFAESDVVGFCKQSTDFFPIGTGVYPDIGPAKDYNDCIANQAIKLHKIDYCNNIISAGKYRSTPNGPYDTKYNNKEPIQEWCQKIVSDPVLSSYYIENQSWGYGPVNNFEQCVSVEYIIYLGPPRYCLSSTDGVATHIQKYTEGQ